MQTSLISEKELLDFLQNPAGYPHAPENVELIQTHISFVAIAPPCVYKIKKAVDLGFLDFSTLTKREHFCREEVRLNRRLCPDTYEGVIPISRTSRGLALECDSNVVEVAVKMKLLPHGRFLHRLVDRNQASSQDLERVAEHLRAFYDGQRSSPEIAEWGRIDKLRISTRENFEQVESFVEELVTAPALSTIRAYTETFFQTHEPLLNRRRAGGHIRDCHGDLRLEHIHVTDEAVRIFDCIEFSQRLRCIDTANDAAFLAMDLDYHGRPDLASAFVKSLFRGISDRDIAGLLDFYKCYRACVRAKVEGIRSREAEVRDDERQASRDRAIRFFQLALHYTVAGSNPAVVAVMGRIGSGKSTVARILSEALGWALESSDRTRKRLAPNRSEHGSGQTRNASRQDALYSEPMTTRTYDALIQGAFDRASRGHSTILDATFGNRTRRDKLRRRLRSAGVRYCFIELRAPEPVRKERLGQRDASSSHASDARLENFDLIDKMYEAPDALEDAHHREVNAARSAGATAHQVLKHLAAYKHV